MERSTEVVVVGAGPVGLAVAASLRSHGRQVIVVDRLAEGANTSRAAVIHASTLAALDRIGVSDRLVEAGLSLTDFSVREGRRVLLRADFAGLPSKYRSVLMLAQPETERILLERLEELGGSVDRPVAATGLTRSVDGIELTLDNGDLIQAQYVVAADGMHGTVRELAGMTMPGNQLPLSFSLVDVRVEGELTAEEVGLYFAPDGLLVVAPLPDGSFRLVAAVEQAPEYPDLAYAQELLDARGPRTGVKVTGVIWGSRFRIHERVADSYRSGRVLLAGDAAHTHSPAGGQGMNLGLRDAIALGDALAQALESTDEALLDRYADEARAEALRVVALAHRLTMLANVPRRARPMRNLVLGLVGRLPWVRRELALQLAGLPKR